MSDLHEKAWHWERSDCPHSQKRYRTDCYECIGSLLAIRDAARDLACTENVKNWQRLFDALAAHDRGSAPEGER